MKSILVIRYSALGDVVLATSIIRGLRAQHPGARIEWLTNEGFAGLLEGVVDRVIGFSRTARSLAVADVRGRFELCIDLQNKVWSRRVAHAAAPERRFFAKRDAWQALKSLVGRDTVLNGAHATALYAEAAGVEAAPIFLHDHQGARAAQVLAPGARWVAVAPGASKENKRWPAERLAEVARRLREDGFRVALLGGPMDGELLNIVRPHVDADLSSESLPVLASALKRVAVLIGNDSGLVHVAGAMGTPAVAIFGPTSVNRWGPQGKGVAVSLGLACAPCSNHGGAKCPLGHHDCLQKLDVERVLGAARALLR